MVSIAHWLDTFTCSKYAERFERSGLQNINTVSQITPAQLHSLGVASNDIYTIMENVVLLKQSMKTLNTPKSFDINSEAPSSTARSRTASPAINPLNRTMSQNPTSYSPGRNVSTPPASSGPSPDRASLGPPTFDTPPNFHRTNSYSNPVNPNTFFDISPSSSTSSPHRSTSIDALPLPSMEPPQFNEYLPQLQPPPQLPPPPHQFQPPGMMYRGPNPPPPGGYYNPPPPRFYSPDQQQQQSFMHANQRMMMHPQQQHPLWNLPRPGMPPQPMLYHPYEHPQFRMASAQQFYQPNHPIMSDQSSMFMNQPPQQLPPPPSCQQQQQTNMNSSASNKLSPTGEPHPHPLQSLERLVLLPESQVIDPKSVVNEIHDPQSPFSESLSLSPFNTLSPKNSVSNPTIVSNLLTNDKSIHDSHGKTSSSLKRSLTHDERNDFNKKNRLNTTNDLNTGDSIINNHPVVTSLLIRGLNNSPSQAPLPSIKSLQQKHNPSFLHQQQQQMMFPSTQTDSQSFVDGLINHEDFSQNIDSIERNYDDLMANIRHTISKDKKFLNSKTNIQRLQFDGIVDTSQLTTTKINNQTSKKRHLSVSSERGTSNSENRTTSSLKPQLNKSNSDSINDYEKKRTRSFNKYTDRSQTSKQCCSKTNLDKIHSMNGHQTTNSPINKINKPKVIQSSQHSNHDDQQNTNSSVSSSSKSRENQITTNDFSSKPIREAKKRSLIYTGNTREFLETAIACGLIDDNGDEDDDNEYMPPGGKRLSTLSSLDNDEDEQQSNKNSEDETDQEEKSDDDDDDEQSDDDEEEEQSDEDREEEMEKTDEDKMIVNNEPSESGINWNVRNRPKRDTHSIRFNEISKQDEQRFFGELQQQIPELAAYLDDNSDDEYQINENEFDNEQPKSSSRKSTNKKSRQTPTIQTSEQDDETVEMIKKFRHVNVPSDKRSRRKSQTNDSTTMAIKNRADELYVILNDDNNDAPRTILSGSQLDSSKAIRKHSTIQSFQFDRRAIKMNSVEDTKAPWRCIFCWKQPYENYLGPLFGPFTLNEQCQTYLKNNKQLAKHYRKLKETWLHRDCAIWNNHTQMNPTTGELMHVSDACSIYLDITCSVCQMPGATLACRYRNCKIRYHYPCVKSTVNARLVEENYSVYCPKHNQMNINKSKVNRRRTTASINDSQET